MKDFLESKGYKLWQSDKDKFGETNKYFKTIKDFQPSCESNSNVSLNITHSIWHNGSLEHTYFEINLVHERKGSEWCNFNIYSLTEEQLKENIVKYESSLLELWTLFYNQGE